MALLDHLLGDPEGLSVAGLERGIRRGSEPFVVRCVRALGERGDRTATAPLLSLLVREEAGLRRAAARALGHLAAPSALAPLRAAWASERTEEGRVAIAVACVRCGDDPAPLADALDRYDRRALHTVGGSRSPAAVHGLAPLSERLWSALGARPGTVQDRPTLLAERRRRLAAGHTAVAPAAEPSEGPAPKRPHGSSAVREPDPARTLNSARTLDPAQALAVLGHPDDLALLLARLRSAGRRGEHTLYAALGLTGDPRAAILLRDALRATDVDPGRGFAQRRIAATGLGRLGLRQGAAWIARALQDEVADFEGRPGAGLGIQYPVRTNLLWALGEIGDPASLPTLLAHLDDTHGSALGGFYLPAMDALTKLGPAAFVRLRHTARHATEITAAHAVGVLAASGDDVRVWAADPRPTVRALARRALDDTAASSGSGATATALRGDTTRPRG